MNLFEKKIVGLFSMILSLPFIAAAGNIPGEGVSAFPVKDGLNLLQDIQEYRVGYQYNNKPVCWMPVGWGGNFTWDTGIAFYPAEASNRKAFLLQSPWRNGTGTTWVDYKLSLPQKGKISFAFGFAMANDDRVRRNSDGVTFSAYIFCDGKQETLLNRHYQSSKWIDTEFNLNKYSGRTVVVRFQVAPGPENSPSWDWSYFSQPRIIVEQDAFTCWKVPDKKMLSTEYQITINGKPADVSLVKVEGLEFEKFRKRFPLMKGDYSFLQFDFSKPVKIRIHSKRNLDTLQILPLSKNVSFFPTGKNTVDIVIDRPMQLSFEPEGRKHPLLIFANPVEKAPDLKTSGLVFYGPGVHHPKDNKIILKDNMTLYLAGGAVVQAGVIVRGKNVKICGRGILDGTPWPWKKGPTRNMLHVQDSDNVTIEGIVIQNPWHWTLPMYNSRNIKIDNIKICGGRVPNDDGIDPCNAQNIQVRNSFVHTIDDCIAPKGVKRAWGNVENILFENMVLWCDASRSVLLGHESQAEYMRNFIFHNIDIIHYNQIIFLMQPGDGMKLENITFKNIRINGKDQDKQIYAALINPTINRYTQIGAAKNKKKISGSIKNILFENVLIHGCRNERNFFFCMQGWDPEHGTENVTFRNVYLNSLLLSKNSPNFFTFGNCKNIKAEGCSK